ncbi:MAG: hypothetical protein RR365_11350 [Bacteroides sp.]
MRTTKESSTPRSGLPKTSGKKTPTGKRIGKSRPEKMNNQLNRRVKG